MQILILRRCLMSLIACVGALFFTPVHAAPTAPTQPLTGPGGSMLPHQSVKMFEYGRGAQQYWIYEPANPIPVKAPVIIFLHGWGTINPKTYGAWIDHLVRRGNIVIYPRWQETALTPVQEYTPNVIASLVDAFSRLQYGAGHVRPETEHVAAVGHSVGALLTANLAALAIDAGLPPIKAFMSVEPGRTWNKAPLTPIPLAAMRKIPSSTLLISMSGDADDFVGDADAKRIYDESTSVPTVNKNLILLVSDNHTTPLLKANHYAPAATDENYDNHLPVLQFGDTSGMGNGIGHTSPPNQTQPITLGHRATPAWDTDALDWYGTWKVFDGLCDTAFFATNRAFALGNTPEQRFMGKWSDGVPVNELIAVGSP